MASTSSEGEPYLKQVGVTAGVVWHTLGENGPMSFAKLVKSVGQPRDVVMQAIGWLAREGKITIDDSRRGRTIQLRKGETAG